GFYKEEFINLNMVKTCKASTITRTTSGNNKIIDRLFLTFNFKDKSKSDLILEFYNVDIKYQLNDEVKKIEKWHKLIVGLLEN
ncbi:MAG: hypothetical protein CMC76_02495, partial [Flavobacteriaceae bacterium]|nr:hypothetical protein [Flavobacteriaceae bacterium]